MFWNASMLPLITLLNLAGGVMIRRGFGLQSGLYDVAIGVLNTILAHSEIGLPSSINQFVPGLERAAGRSGVVHFLRRIVRLRLGLLIVALVFVNVFAQPLSARLHLGDGGVRLVRLVSLLALTRAGTDLAISTLQSLLAHLQANIIQLALAFSLVAVVTWTIVVHASVVAIFAGLVLTGTVVVLGAFHFAKSRVAALSQPGEPSPGESPGVSTSRLWRFAAFMYVFEASSYFATPAFASPVLAAASSALATVALFNVGYQLPMMVVVIILSGFQGLYRPFFAGILAEQSKTRVQTAFSEISKVQAVLLIPAGVGLALMLPDLIAVLFTRQFAAAIPLARLLCVFLFLEALFNLGFILLSVDHRYREALAAQAMRILGAPVFVVLAIRGDLQLATIAFGVSRLLASAFGFIVARRLYGVRFPVAFTMRVCATAVLMGVVVAAGRVVIQSPWLAVAILIPVGAAVALIGMRWFGVLGDRELDLLRRAGLPGQAIVLQWLGVSPER
jgi:O-antigen/teichoic acid export membrane protein